MSAKNLDQQPKFQHRIASKDDVTAIIELMQTSITENMKAYLSPVEIEAAKETMGVDRTLIEDGSYFLIEAMLNQRNAEAGVNVKRSMEAIIPKAAMTA